MPETDKPRPTANRAADKATDASRLRALSLGALLTAFALGLFGLGRESLWYDETVSAFLSRHDPVTIIQRTAGDIHPPGYYLLLHVWRALAHPTLEHGLEFLLTWPSFVWGVLIVALMVPIGRRFFGAGPALAAAWLAAVSPYLMWYAQEVRMYTQGAALGLLCFWGMVTWFQAEPGHQGHRWRQLTLYVVAAVAGLYTLYYFVFLLIALNAGILLLWWRQRRVGHTPTPRAGEWLAAQIGVVVLFAPWLPVLWHQAVTPPVPPWRASWTDAGDLLSGVVEIAAAWLVGQSPPGAHLWPWALAAGTVTIAALVIGGQSRAKGDQPNTIGDGVLLVAMTLLLPAALIIFLTVAVTPLYHVRYLFTFAPFFWLLAGLVVARATAHRRAAGMALLAALLLVEGAGVREFHRNPAYESDDHRTAVAELAAQWRPGDVVLINAGWTHTALDTYWPRRSATPWDTVPPPLQVERLIDYVNKKPFIDPAAVLALRTGSVDGADTLGWGNPASDFFAMRQEESRDALHAVTADFDRIWHYRMYDTVSDPHGVLRQWLDANTSETSATPYPGRDYLLVQQLATERALPPMDEQTADAAHFSLPDAGADAAHILTLQAHTPLPATVEASAPLYVTLFWEPARASMPELAMSLRLYDADGLLWAQADSRPDIPTSMWPEQMQSEQMMAQPLALPLPAALPPGTYHAELIVYQSENGLPLTLQETPRTIDGQRWQLGTVDTQTPAAPPPPQRGSGVQAQFDYIRLDDAITNQATILPGETITLGLLWRPVDKGYRDAYTAVLALRNRDGAVAQEWRVPLGGDRYPSSLWPPAFTVAQQIQLTTGTDLPPGQYELGLSLERSSDGLPIPARQGFLQPGVARIALATLDIATPAMGSP